MYHFIVNPHSRSGLGKKIWFEIEEILSKKHITYTVYLTKYQKHATQIVSEICRDHLRHTLVVLGGDGTINEAVNGICDFSKVTLGYIPIGSSNDFARSLHLPADPLAALEVILKEPYIREIDVGVLSYGNKTRLFATSAGIGFDAAVCHEAVVSKLKIFFNKIKLGKLTYTGIAISQLHKMAPSPMTLTLDDKPSITFDSAYFIAIMNQAYEGGGFKFCPSADSTDGKLDVIVISRLSKLAILFLLPTAFFGLHRFCKKAHLYQAQRIVVASEKALPVHADGEPIYLQKVLKATPIHKCLSVITQNLDNY